MDIVKAPNNKLRIKTKPVKKITPELLKVVKKMVQLAASFKDPEGVGLASTQVGLEESFFVAKMGEEFEVFFNPKVLKVSEKKKVFFEGCLSIPDYFGEVARPMGITVSYLDVSGKEVKKRLGNVRAWIFQHETDHLDGKLFVDLVLSQKSKMFKIVGKDKAGSDVFEEVNI